MKFLFLFFIFISYAFSSPLQDAINNAPANSTLKLSAGTYSGNIIIDKPLMIIAKEGAHVVIEGDGTKSVVTITSSNVSLKNLTIAHSGDKKFTIDSGISMNHVKKCEINTCKIIDCLYGIDMNMVSDSLIINNYITSKKLDIELRGNALKLYYSHRNIIKNNTVENSKDVTLNYSNKNQFLKNKFLNNRFATHLSLSNDNSFVANIYKYNSVSLMIMGAKNTLVRNNTILSSKGAAGIGVVVGGVANFTFIKNRVSFNAKGIYIDATGKAKGMKRYISYNEISYNGEAIHFHAAIKDNTITHNKIFGNIEDLVRDSEGDFSKNNIVEYNYWDRYAGFDRDHNNIGDTPYKVYQYADQLWQYNHKVKFFYASPIMSLLNFMSRIAPFIEPNLILEDKKPIFLSL
jgi:nitrous oxidase accessory protein